MDRPNMGVDCVDILLIISFISFQVSEELLGVLIAEI
jgi:hypothetical protein